MPSTLSERRCKQCHRRLRVNARSHATFCSRRCGNIEKQQSYRRSRYTQRAGSNVTVAAITFLVDQRDITILDMARAARTHDVALFALCARLMETR